MLTKEQILEVLEDYTNVLDEYREVRGVGSWEYEDIADALLKLQGTAPEGTIPEGYITEECPPGYVAKENGKGCKECAFITSDYACMNMDARCFASERKDGKYVIFIRKEDAK